ncbi:MAG: hypothetical protein KJ057_03240 [Phycisphaerae bacterium]|nr:hypothetical protein [Planctomycetia bacterium]MCK6463817.1 hypothetical protein [Phycisphaerae bacterium]MCL4717468.1 hypothetical protein [Phycisphaerae bacterium]NUQ07611.1 hypothetical protein [Phycisphaerae bacterium]
MALTPSEAAFMQGAPGWIGDQKAHHQYVSSLCPGQRKLRDDKQDKPAVEGAAYTE